MDEEIRARIANVLRTHHLIDGRCNACGQQAVYQSLHQADVLMGMSGLSINLMQEHGMNRDELVAFARWLLKDEFGEGREVTIVDQYLAQEQR
ncbi:hypothetical protein [Mycolicibacterium fortuitum]